MTTDSLNPKPRTVYWFVFADADNRIRIKGKRKPTLASRPASGTWVCQEWSTNPITGECKWLMPSCPEITWGRLKKMTFIRKEPVA